MQRTAEAYAIPRSRLSRGATPDGTLLHLTNGDSAASSLRRTGLGGRVLPWRDVLHEGPVPGGLTAASLRRIRAHHLARRFQGDVAQTERRLAARDRALRAAAHGVYVLWFEADLYDQLQLIQILDALVGHDVEPARVTLVSIGEYPGIAHFGGLGELSPDQLARLPADGVALRPQTMELAVAAWQAFTAPEPEGLAAIAGQHSAELRFLGEAFGRLMQEYPSGSDGLSLTERRILLATAEGPAPAGRVFQLVWRAERRPFLGDAVCWAFMRDLAGGAHPLLEIEDSGQPFPERAVSLTSAGRRILAGELDQTRLNGIDRWVGGVHLTGEGPAWRYDERLERLVRVS
jgi:hypothetical protein